MRLLLLGLLIVTLCGCSVPTYVYIRNISGTAKQVLFTKKHPNQKDTFRFTLANVRIGRKLANELTDTLSVRSVNDSVVLVEIPAHATVLIDKTMNCVSFKYSYVNADGHELIRDGFVYSVEDGERRQEGLTLSGCYYLR